MTDDALKHRLQFLARVAEKECRHLNSTAARLFTTPFTVETAEKLEDDERLSEQVEAFVARFARLQDTLGDKLIPHLLAALGEKRRSVVDNLDTAERLEWIPSADEWQAMRQLRNQMVHEYIEDLALLTTALQTAQDFVPILTAVNDKLQEELRQRGWQD